MRSALSAVLTLSACAAVIGCGEPGDAPVIVAATLAPLPYEGNPTPSLTGYIEMVREPDVTEITVTLRGCAAGIYDAYVHEGTECGDDGGPSGAPWVPGAGILKHVGAHTEPGAIGSIACKADGTGTLKRFASERWDVGGENDYDPTGRTVVLHGGLEGSVLVACGVLTPE